MKRRRRGSSAVVAAGSAVFAMWAAQAWAVTDLTVKIVDHGQPVPGATIRLVGPDGQAVAGEDDDRDGRIVVVLPGGGRYAMTVRLPGGEERTVHFKAPADGSITLQFDAASGRIAKKASDHAEKTAGELNVIVVAGVGGSSTKSASEDTFFGSPVMSEGEGNSFAKGSVTFGVSYRLPGLPIIVSPRATVFYGTSNLSIVNESLATKTKELWAADLLIGYPVGPVTLYAGPRLARDKVYGGFASPIGEKEYAFSPVAYGKKLKVQPTFAVEYRLNLSEIGLLGPTSLLVGTRLSVRRDLHVSYTGVATPPVENRIDFWARQRVQWGFYAGLAF